VAAYEVRVSMAPGLLMAVASARVRPGEVPKHLIPLLDTVYAFFKATGMKHRGINIGLYEAGSPEFMMHAGVQVDAAFDGSGGITCMRTPTGPAATVAHIGPYDGIPRAHEAVRAWARENGRRLTGVNWEVYGHWTDNPLELRTDIWYSLAV
jgi:effector-binding domain-containing protein